MGIEENYTSEHMENEPQDTGIARRPRRHTKPQKVRDTVFYIRQVLNILFMLTAVVGALMYCGVFGKGVEMRQGIIVIIIAVSIKMAECMLRFKK